MGWVPVSLRYPHLRHFISLMCHQHGGDAWHQGRAVIHFPTLLLAQRNTPRMKSQVYLITTKLQRSLVMCRAILTTCQGLVTNRNAKGVSQKKEDSRTISVCPDGWRRGIT